MAIHAGNLYVSPLLTKFALAYTNENYIAEKIFPTVKVNKDTGQIATYSADNLRIEETERAQGSQTNEVSHTVTISSHYTLVEHAIKELVTDEERQNYDNPIEPERDAVQNLTEKLMVMKESAIATVCDDESTLTNYTTLVTATQWDNYASATSDPIGAIRTGVDSVRTNAGKRANTLIIAKNAVDYLLDHPDIVDRLKYVNLADKANAFDALARIFGLDQILVGNSIYNSAVEGQTDSLSDIWSKFAVVAYIDPNPSMKTRTFGVTYTRGATRSVDKWRDTDRKGDWIRCTDKYQQKVVDASCAYLIKSCIS